MKSEVLAANDPPLTNVPPGRLEARYLAFLETIAQLRPSLHRFCARMTGSVLDGEDVVQEALFQAYRKLGTFDESRPLKPWLFRIAHNRCIDFLRQRTSRTEAEAKAAIEVDDFTPPVDAVGPALGQAVEHLVLALPPKERACVLLKDVFDYSLEEIAELVDSTVGGVKAALHRGRGKLAERPINPLTTRAPSPEHAPLLRLYVERFNQRDWAGVRELISADARLLVVDRYAGRVADSPYFGIYGKMTEPWRLALGEIDGGPALIFHGLAGTSWTPKAAVSVRVVAGKIVDITDYWFCPWIVTSLRSLPIDGAV